MKNYLLLGIVCLSQLFAELLYPPNNSHLSQIEVMFKWEGEATKTYVFEISDQTNFASSFINHLFAGDIAYLEKDYISWNEDYYWRVKEEGGAWINTYQFTTGSKSLSNVDLTWYLPDNYSHGYTIMGSAQNTYSIIIDKEGTEIWNSGDENIIFYSFNKNGSFFGTEYDPTHQYIYPSCKFSLTDGVDNTKIVWQDPHNVDSHHEFIQLPSSFPLTGNHYLGLADDIQPGPILCPSNQISTYQNMVDETGQNYVADGVTYEYPWRGDRLIIWDENGNEVWSWSTFDHFDTADHDPIRWSFNPSGNIPFKWTHANAFYYDERDASIYLSSCYLDRITKISYPSGEVIWNMGHEFPSGNVHFGHDLNFSQQHSITLSNAGNLLLFDNGNYSPAYWDDPEQSPKSRALEISVTGSEGAYAANIVWKYVLPTNLFGPEAGSVQQLQNGNYFITTQALGGTSLEVLPLAGLEYPEGLVWVASYGTFLTWRAQRISGFCPWVDLGDLDANGCRNISDVTKLINCILDQNCLSSDYVYGCAGDIDRDNSYNIVDILYLVDWVLTQNCY